MDSRTQALSYSQIMNLYGALKADIKKYNDSLDKIGQGMQRIKSNMSKQDRQKVSQHIANREIKQYGKLFNKYADEETAKVPDRFESRHEELVKNGNADEFKMGIPRQINGLDRITEEQWNRTSNDVKLEIERIIRNKLYYIAEAALSAINSGKYKGENSSRYNQQLFVRKNKAIVNFLVKLYEANELLEPNEQHYAGISTDKGGNYVISTIGMSVHFGNDAKMIECLNKANDILIKGRRNVKPPYNLLDVMKNFKYDIPRYENNTGLVSYGNTGEILKYVTDLKARVLTSYSKGKILRYRIDYSKLEEYINTTRAYFNDREIFHLIDRLNHEERVPVFGKTEIAQVKKLLKQRAKDRGNKAGRRSAKER